MSDRRRSLLVSLLCAAAAAGGACSAPGSGPPHHPPTLRPTIEATTADPDGATECGEPLVVDGPLDSLAAAVDQLAAAVDTDGAGTGCAVVVQPVCAALFLIGATDPIAALGAGLSIDDIDRLAELHHRVLVDGAEAARQHRDLQLEAALQAIIDLEVRAAVGRDDIAAAAVAVARSDPAIVGPIASAESSCG